MIVLLPLPFWIAPVVQDDHLVDPLVATKRSNVAPLDNQSSRSPTNVAFDFEWRCWMSMFPSAVTVALTMPMKPTVLPVPTW
jgi:hypothetical protein